MRIYDRPVFWDWMSGQIQNRKYHRCYHKSHYQQWNWLPQVYQHRRRIQNHAYGLNCLMYLKHKVKGQVVEKNLVGFFQLKCVEAKLETLHLSRNF